MIVRRCWLALAVFAPGPLSAQGLHYEGGLSIATGAYIFTERTTTWTLSTGFAAGLGPVTARATVPVYLQNTTLVAAGPLGGVPTGGASSGAVADSSAARKRRHDGLQPMMAVAATGVEVPSSAVTGFRSAFGDPTISLAVRAVGGPRGYLNVGAAAKLPVADTATFGTGRWDVGATAALGWAPATSVLLSFDVAYWHLGDLADLDFRDPVYGTVALGYLGRAGWGGSLFAAAGTSTIDGFTGPASVGAALTHITGRTGWSLHAAAGLSETSPDVTVGMGWRVRLLR